MPNHKKREKERKLAVIHPDYVSDEIGRITAVDFEVGSCYYQEQDYHDGRSFVPKWGIWKNRTMQLRHKPSYEEIKGPFVVLKEIAFGRYTILLANGKVETCTFPINGLYRKIPVNVD